MRAFDAPFGHGEDGSTDRTPSNFLDGWCRGHDPDAPSPAQLAFFERLTVGAVVLLTPVVPPSLVQTSEPPTITEMMDHLAMGAPAILTAPAN